jgi:hypothetical protein
MITEFEQRVCCIYLCWRQTPQTLHWIPQPRSLQVCYLRCLLQWRSTPPRATYFPRNWQFLTYLHTGRILHLRLLLQRYRPRPLHDRIDGRQPSRIRLHHLMPRERQSTVKTLVSRFADQELRCRWSRRGLVEEARWSCSAPRSRFSATPAIAQSQQRRSRACTSISRFVRRSLLPQARQGAANPPLHPPESPTSVAASLQICGEDGEPEEVETAEMNGTNSPRWKSPLGATRGCIPPLSMARCGRGSRWFRHEQASRLLQWRSPPLSREPLPWWAPSSGCLGPPMFLLPCPGRLASLAKGKGPIPNFLLSPAIKQSLIN